jgi:hypothetical protein
MVVLALMIHQIMAVVVVEAHPQREVTEHQPLQEMAETELRLVLLEPL